jgi:hypothetical protein
MGASCQGSGDLPDSSPKEIDESRMPFDPLLKPMRLGLSKQTPSRGPLDVVICGDWRLSVEALSLDGTPTGLPPGSLRRAPRGMGT